MLAFSVHKWGMVSTEMVNLLLFDSLHLRLLQFYYWLLPWWLWLLDDYDYSAPTIIIIIRVIDYWILIDIIRVIDTTLYSHFLKPSKYVQTCLDKWGCNVLLLYT